MSTLSRLPGRREFLNFLAASPILACEGLRDPAAADGNWQHRPICSGLGSQLGFADLPVSSRKDERFLPRRGCGCGSGCQNHAHLANLVWFKCSLVSLPTEDVLTTP